MSRSDHGRMELPTPDMGYYGPGGETTGEERFLYNPDMVEFLNEWVEKLPTNRTELENFAWALRQKTGEIEGW